jgi:L-malate glycosyltransferase
MKEMHVLIIPTAYPNDYNPVSNIFFRDQAEALASNGFKVGVLALVPITIQQIFKKRKFNFGLQVFKENGVMTYLFMFPVLPKSEPLKQWLRKTIGLWVFKKYQIDQGIPDIQHVHVFLAACTARSLKKKYKIPYVITEHSTAFARKIITSYENILARKAYTDSNRNIAVSQEFAKLLSNTYGHSFSYIPNVVNTTYFRPVQNKKTNKKIRLLNLGNLEVKKQQNLLLQCFQRVVKEYPLAELVIGGSGPEEGRLKNHCSLLGLETHVLFLGKLDRQEVLKEMQKCDIFVLSSKIETFGVVLIEAMACGIPVVSTCSGGPESIIIDEKYGILTENSSDSLFVGIVKAITNKANFNSDEIRSYVEEYFSERAISVKLKKVYQQAIECQKQ